jgi:hypothetical protein
VIEKSYDVAVCACGKSNKVIVGPFLEREIPGQLEKARTAGSSTEGERNHVLYLNANRARQETNGAKCDGLIAAATVSQ